MMNQDHPLRLVRLSQNLSIEDVARATGLGWNTILRAEQGYELRPSSRRHLCDFFRMTAAELSLFPSSGRFELSEVQQSDLLSLRPGLRREVEKYMATHDA